MQLNWIKCQGDVWCKLNAVNLDHEHFNDMHGIYIIWHGGPEPAVVYVGQGNIKEALAKQRDNAAVQQYAHLDLYVTWAAVPKEYRRGVESYLANKWAPKVDVSQPQLFQPTREVNSPWQ